MKSKSNPYLSIIIPLYNEEKRIENINIVIKYLKSRKFVSELILVNDGSKDNTLVLLDKFKNDFPINVISYKINKGKGFAIKKGMLAAKGKFQLFIDVDNSTPIEFCDVFLKNMNINYQVAIGTRKNKKAQIIVHQPIIRESMGKVYTFLANMILALKVTDVTCGFKCFSRKASQDIFTNISSNRWGFDAETIAYARKLNYDLLEIPVKWTNERDSKVKLPQDAFYSFLELIKIWKKVNSN